LILDFDFCAEQLLRSCVFACLRIDWAAWYGGFDLPIINAALVRVLCDCFTETEGERSGKSSEGKDRHANIARNLAEEANSAGMPEFF